MTIDIISSSIHTPGHCEILFSADGSKIYSGGDDSQLYVFSTSNIRNGSVDLTNSINSDNHDAGILCMALRTEILVTGSDDQFVRLLNANNLDCQKILQRSTVPISSVSLTHDATRAAVASDEAFISIYELTRAETRRLKGHTSAIKYVSFDPSGKILASTSQDGSLRFWNMSEEVPSCIQELKGVMSKAGREENDLSRGSWHPDGETFACPGKNGEVFIVERNKWKIIAKLSHKEKVSSCYYSPNGVYLLVLGCNNTVTIWRPDNSISECVVSHNFSSRPTSAAWHPKANEILLADSTGALLYWPKVIAEGLPHPVTGSEKRKIRQQSDLIRTTELASRLFETNDESPAENFQIPSSAGHISKKDGNNKSRSEKLEDYYGEDMDDLFGSENDEIDDDEELRDFVIDDDGAGYLDELDKAEGMRKYHERSRRSARKALSKEGIDSNGIAGLGPLSFNGQDPQEPFQSNTTPLRGNRRYLAFNLHGYVACIDNGMNCTIQVEFHDKTNRPTHFSDIFKFSMAALGAAGVAVASEMTGTAPSVVHFKPFGSWATKGDWTIRLNEGENAQAIAITKTHIAVATDRYYLRLFSYSGLQTEIRSLPGRIVTMTGSNHLLVVVYHDGPVNANDQTESLIILDLELKKVIHRGRLSLSPDSKLEWIGFTEDNLLSTFDSHGVLRILLRSMDYDWVPVLDTRTLKSKTSDITEHYWPVGIAESKFMCIICKGQKYPVTDRPLLHEMPLQLPLANLEGPSVSLEEKWIRERIFIGEAEISMIGSYVPTAVRKRQLEMDKIGIQLFLNACKAERVERALDLAAAFYNDKTLDGAMKIAVSHHLPSLAERLNSMKERRHERRRQEEDRETHYHVSTDNHASITYVSHHEREPVHTSQSQILDDRHCYDTLKSDKVEQHDETIGSFDEKHTVLENADIVLDKDDHQIKKKRKKVLNPFAMKADAQVKHVKDKGDEQDDPYGDESDEKRKKKKGPSSGTHLFHAIRSITSTDKKDALLNDSIKNTHHLKKDEVIKAQKQATLLNMLPLAQVHVTTSTGRASSSSSHVESGNDSNMIGAAIGNSKNSLMASFVFTKPGKEQSNSSSPNKENMVDVDESVHKTKGKTKTYDAYPDIQESTFDNT